MGLDMVFFHPYSPDSSERKTVATYINCDKSVGKTNSKCEGEFKVSSNVCIFIRWIAEHILHYANMYASIPTQWKRKRERERSMHASNVIMQS